MKRKFVVLLLCLCIIGSLALASPIFADTRPCFISVNNVVLEYNVLPYFSGNVIYVPYWIFTDYGFPIYYTYFSETSTAMLYTSESQLFFDVKNGGSYDGNDGKYASSAVIRNGTVYVPASFVCGFFGGLTCSYISGDDYGDLVRITDGSQYLTDSQFIKAASIQIQSRYEATMRAKAPKPTPTPTPDTEIRPLRVGAKVYLGFVGLPDSTLLSALKRYELNACFFLTEEDVLSSPDTVRRLCCDGYALGVCCGEDPDGDYARTSELIFEAARVKTVLAVCPDGEAERGFPVTFSYDNKVLSDLENAPEDISVLLDCGDSTGALAAILELHSNMFNARAPREDA